VLAEKWPRTFFCDRKESGARRGCHYLKRQGLLKGLEEGAVEKMHNGQYGHGSCTSITRYPLGVLQLNAHHNTRGSFLWSQFNDLMGAFALTRKGWGESARFSYKRRRRILVILLKIMTDLHFCGLQLEDEGLLGQGGHFGRPRVGRFP
jgi:hypothetical protein